MSQYYFIGIKGTGMSSLACILKENGHEVSGCDLAKHFFTEEGLNRMDIPYTSFEDAQIPVSAIVIIGNAFLDDFPLVVMARKQHECYRYHEFLKQFLQQFTLIGIAGSHGKTTTTGLMSAVCSQHDLTGYLIGDGSGHCPKQAKYFCLESDEFRRLFLNYHPTYAIITNIEIDHVDYYRDKQDYLSAYQSFVQQVSKGLLICGDDEECRKLKIDVDHLYYGLSKTNDLYADEIQYQPQGMEFDVMYHGQFFGHFSTHLVGRHILLDILGVIGIGIFLKMTPQQIQDGLDHYVGVKRRFVIEYHHQSVFVDDYAHHPTEVAVTIDSARLRFPKAKIVAVFKPHRASRVAYFRDEFKQALEKADAVYLCDFTSIDDKQDGTDIDITYLANVIEGSCIVSEDEQGAKMIAQQGDAVYLFMSSKDIYPLANLVKKLV